VRIEGVLLSYHESILPVVRQFNIVLLCLVCVLVNNISLYVFHDYFLFRSIFIIIFFSALLFNVHLEESKLFSKIIFFYFLREIQEDQHLQQAFQKHGINHQTTKLLNSDILKDII